MIKNDPYYGQPLPNPGLPEELPQGETMLWQGTPRWENLAVSVFHTRKVLAWFGFLLLWGFVARLLEGQGVLSALITPGRWLVPMGLAATAILLLLAWLTARNSLYTITSKRVVFRIGIALTMTINVPFGMIDAANLKRNADGTGDLALVLRADSKIAWVILWPHSRPWQLSRPKPMLRAIADPQKVAAILSRGLAQTMQGGAAQPASRQTDAGASAAPALSLKGA